MFWLSHSPLTWPGHVSFPGGWLKENPICLPHTRIPPLPYVGLTSCQYQHHMSFHFNNQPNNQPTDQPTFTSTSDIHSHDWLVDSMGSCWRNNVCLMKEVIHLLTPNRRKVSYSSSIISTTPLIIIAIIKISVATNARAVFTTRGR